MGRDRTIVSRLRASSARPLPAEPLEQRVLFSSVVGRFLFYNNSSFDGREPALNDQDLGAVAIDKVALLPGRTASFQNYTAYSRGINGLEVDLAGETGTPTLGSFEFKVGTGDDPASWSAAPAPTQMVRLAPDQPQQPARYLFAWADGAIANQWLRVTVKANAETGLPAPDVFYFGNLVGETGNETAEAAVDAADYVQVRRMAGRGAGLAEPADFNHDRRVNASDLAIVRGRLLRPPLPLITAPPQPDSPAAVGQWSPVINWPLVAINQVLLRDGRILMWDGNGSGPCIGSTSARVYDPGTDQFTPVPLPYFSEHEDDIFCSAQTLLADGRVLVVGGHDCDGPGLGIVMSNLFDPATMTWTRGPDMHFARWYPTVTTLADGRALVLGGSSVTTTDYVSTPEVYDPVTNTFTSLTAATLKIPSYAFVCQNVDGRVIVTGSDEAKMPTYAFDVQAQKWSVVDPAVLDAGSGVMYRPGRFMKAGSSYLSQPIDNGGATPSKPNTYVLDATAAAPAWQETAPMAFARTHLNLTLLPDGNVLATGGSSDIGGLTASRGVLPAEMWSPDSKTWTTLPAMATPRMYHSTALLMPDGRVLVAGGGRLYVADNFQSAEYYSPAYLFRGARPTISSAPAKLTYGQAFVVGTPDAHDIASVALVRNGAVTHSDNMNQRYIPLAFEAVAGGLSVQAPPDAVTAPPGDYMLFIVNRNGVPSIAPFVRFPAGYEDHQSPTAPSSLAAAGAPASATLTWNASTDDVGVTGYAVYRSASPGFTPTDANRVGTAPTNTFHDTGVSPGTWYYLARALDAAGNVSPPSNQAAAVVTPDTVAPTATLTSPAAGARASGVVELTADASDDVGVVSLQFLVDGAPAGAADSTAPYSFTWSTWSVPNGGHVLSAVATDVGGNVTTSAPVTVTVANTSLPGLVAAYAFDEGAGAVANDASGHGLAGTVSGASWTTAGKFGAALSFHGADSLVTVPDADALDLTTGMTLEAWVRPAALGRYRTILLKEVAGELSYSLYASGDQGSPNAWARVDGTSVGVYGADPLPLEQWSHVAATYDGVSLVVYVNGVPVGSRALSGPMQTSDRPLDIGGNGVWGEYFTGLIDDVRVYNRALSVAEIRGDMGRPVSPSTDTVAPSVSLTAPAAGATVSGVVQLEAGASDDVGVAGVRFLVDGVQVGAEDINSPYSVAWDTSAASAGDHVLTAVARDAAGNSKTSDPVTVTVSASNDTPGGPVAAYGFDDGAGPVAADASGHGHAGTVSGATWSAAGRFGGALVFNGVDSLVTVPDADALDLTSGMTLEAWVRPSALGGFRTIVLKEVPGELAYSLYASGDQNRPNAWARTGGRSVGVYGTDPLPLNAWSHVAATYDGASLVVYVNGTAVASRALTGQLQPSANALDIGGNAVWGEYFSGLIDEVRVYNRALTDAEIRADRDRAISPPAVASTAAAPPVPIATALRRRPVARDLLA